MQETWVQSLGWEDPLEKEMVTHSSLLDWKIPWTEEPIGLQSMKSQRVRHDSMTKQQQFLQCSFYLNMCILWMTQKVLSLKIFGDQNLPPHP